ncbi:GAF and ANTAR domain-containing protein [Blastococcus sp. CT_GayMR16]|uniref:GAF and ANTAR domain-containing protein n=1 Tax=Blastococcus sp. CT_GayMR16 TaxID=2559607 RepID=UPI0010737C52|nr:GAF and ANTAR domain-containing protein [Blastococcus sp. CT_GayMR16]TFV90044.1 ANTAR domain-containing protein [Blastococcus sp. CT_GayMR16]
MSASRERDVTRAFVELASSLANGYDVVELLSGLTADCAHLLDVASAGLLLADGRGVLHVMAASSERTRQLEVFQVQRADGPCRDCYLDGAPVSAPDLHEETDRWPQFAPAALKAGFVSVHALPMRLRNHVLGALGLFGTTAGSLSPDDLSLGQALADVASVALVQDKATTDQKTVNEQLQTALTSRIVLEQAKGVLAQQGSLPMEEAFTVLRHYARDNNLRLTAIAEAVVSRRLPAQQLLDRVRVRRP